MSRVLVDKYDIKNSTLPKSEHQQNIIGYRDTFDIKENYFSIVLKNYSSVGWVFGLAQYGVTPVSTSSGVTEELYYLDWRNNVTFFGNDDSLLVDNNMHSLTPGYKNLQYHFNSGDSSFEYYFLKNPNSTYKFFRIEIKYSLGVEDNRIGYVIGTNQQYEIPSTKLSHYESKYRENIYSYSQIKLLKAIFTRDPDSGMVYWDNKIEYVKIDGYETLQPHIETLDGATIDNENTTGTLSNNKWTGNEHDVLVSKRIYLSPNTKLKAVTFDFKDTDNNLDFTKDKLYLSVNGVDWEWVQFGTGKINFEMSKPASKFTMTFPITLGTALDNASSPYQLFFKIEAGKPNTYIDCSEKPFKIYFYPL